MKRMLIQLFLVLNLLITAAYAFGEDPTGLGGGSAPEPVSTALIGSAISMLLYKKSRE